MSKNWYPIINEENCIECGACAEKCTHGVYTQEGDKPIVVSPEGCIEGSMAAKTCALRTLLRILGRLKKKHQAVADAAAAAAAIVTVNR